MSETEIQMYDVAKVVHNSYMEYAVDRIINEVEEKEG